jgi:hypothetical protein
MKVALWYQIPVERNLKVEELSCSGISRSLTGDSVSS